MTFTYRLADPDGLGEIISVNIPDYALISSSTEIIPVKWPRPTPTFLVGVYRITYNLEPDSSGGKVIKHVPQDVAFEIMEVVEKLKEGPINT